MSIVTLNKIHNVLIGKTKTIDCPECGGDGVIDGERIVGGIDDSLSPYQSYIPEARGCWMCGGFGSIEEEIEEEE
jgi:hypothetical protein